MRRGPGVYGPQVANFPAEPLAKTPMDAAQAVPPVAKAIDCLRFEI
jgi:hypothetical protein